MTLTRLDGKNIRGMSFLDSEPVYSTSPGIEGPLNQLNQHQIGSLGIHVALLGHLTIFFKKVVIENCMLLTGTRRMSKSLSFASRPVALFAMAQGSQECADERALSVSADRFHSSSWLDWSR